MLPVSALLSLLVIICSRRVSAQLRPTTPGPNETYTAGSNCAIAWVPDSSGSWTNVTIDLMSGSNNNMSLVTNVETGLDGTDASLTPFSWTCPEVDPYSTIYFYQFTNGDDISTRAWTTRFTIASPANETEAPENLKQSDGSIVPWGLGRIASGAKSALGSNTSTSTNNTNSSDAIPADSAMEGSSRSKNPHKHKSDQSNSTDTESSSDPEDGDDDEEEVRGERDGKDHSVGDDESEEGIDASSQDKPSTRTHSGANVSGATSAAARASSASHSGSEASPSSPNGSDTNDDGESDDPDDPDNDRHSRSSSGSRSRHDSNPDPDWSSNEGSQAQAQSPFSPHDSGANSQMDPSLSGIVSSVAPCLIVALVALYL